MKNRLHMLMAAAALLYSGPFLAGLAGFGWPVFPVFSAFFMLWLLVIQPQDFPRDRVGWLRPAALVAFVIRALLQAFLVLLCIGLGHGLAGILGHLVQIPLILPIGMSFVAIVLGRLVWDPWKALAMDRLLDDALHEIEEKGAERGDQAYATAVLTPLYAMPDDTSEADLESHLSAIHVLVDEMAVFEALLARVQAGASGLATRRALMLLASDREGLKRMGRLEVPALVMDALRGNGRLIARMAQRLGRGLRRDRGVLRYCPAPEFLAGLRAGLPDAAAAIAELEAEIARQGRQGNRIGQMAGA